MRTDTAPLGYFIWLVLLAAPLGLAATAGDQRPVTPSGKERLWQDERIGIVINKVEIGETLSPKVAESLKGPPSYGPLPVPARARPGNKYVSIVFTLARVNGVYVLSFGPGVKLGIEESSLRDDRGRASGLTYWRSYQLAVPDVHDASKYYLPESGTNLMIFEVPIDATPHSLVVLYAYKETLGEKDVKQGRLDIILPAQ